MDGVKGTGLEERWGGRHQLALRHAMFEAPDTIEKVSSEIRVKWGCRGRLGCHC